MCDETGDILWRITEKQSDLMRKIICIIEPLHQSGNALRGVIRRIAALPQDRFCLIVMQIIRKLCRTVQIDQGMMSAVPQRQNADTLMMKPAVPEAHGFAHFVNAVIAEAEQISGLDAGERRCTVSYHCSLGHERSPFSFGYHMLTDAIIAQKKLPVKRNDLKII